MFRHLCVILREFQNLSFAKLYKDDKETSKLVGMKIIQRENTVIYCVQQYVVIIKTIAEILS
jgi:hypothetical protein